MLKLQRRGPVSAFFFVMSMFRALRCHCAGGINPDMTKSRMDERVQVKFQSDQWAFLSKHLNVLKSNASQLAHAKVTTEKS